MKRSNETFRNPKQFPYTAPLLKECMIDYPKSILGASYEDGEATEMEDGGNDY